MAGARYDVAIVGGSLAGCATATHLGRAGLKVALLERHTDLKAYKHLCTTLIQPGAMPAIRRLGLEASIESAGGNRTGLATWTRWGWIVDRTSGDTGYCIRREKLDPMIRELAASTPGVDYLPGRTARGVVTDRGRIAGVVAEPSGGGSEEIRARLVVAADGRHSEVAKLVGVGARAVRTHNRSGYFGYFRNVELPHPGHGHLWLLEPDAAFAFPHDDGIFVLAVMFDKARMASFKSDVQGNFLAMLSGVPNYARFNPADQVGKTLGLIDYANQWRRQAPPGLAFVGDAAISPDPLFGTGCGWALQEAGWLADATAAAFGSDREIDRAVAAYRSTLRAQLAGHFFLISDYSTGRGFNPAEKMLFSAGAKDAGSAQFVGAIGARSVPAQKVLPAALARAIRVNLTQHRSREAKANRELLRKRRASGGAQHAAAAAS